MPLNDRDGGGLSGWLGRWWRPLVSEVLATSLLIFLGLASLVTLEGPPPLTHPAFAFGLIIIALAQVFGPVSGAHMNPAVSLAAVIYGQMEVVVALAYSVAQTIGALLGFGLLYALCPARMLSNSLGCTVPAVGGPAGAAVEVVLTGLLALLACSCWAEHDAARPDRAVPIKFGLGVAGLVYAGGAMTGASLNPVRSLAPAVFMNEWTHHWVYWVGPLSGAALAAALHRFVLSAPRHPPAPLARDEDVPLNDKAAAAAV